MLYGTKLKELIYENGHTLTSINNKLNQANNTNKTVQNLSNHIRRETLSFTQLLQILDIIDYELIAEPVGDKNANNIFNVRKKYSTNYNIKD